MHSCWLFDLYLQLNEIVLSANTKNWWSSQTHLPKCSLSLTPNSLDWFPTLCVAIVAGHLQQALVWSKVATARSFTLNRGFVTDIMPATPQSHDGVQCIPLHPGCSQPRWCIVTAPPTGTCTISDVQYIIMQGCMPGHAGVQLLYSNQNGLLKSHYAVLTNNCNHIGYNSGLQTAGIYLR